MTSEPEVRALLTQVAALAEACAEAEYALQDYIDQTLDTSGHLAMVACAQARKGAPAAANLIEKLVQETEQLRQEWEDMRGTAMTAEHERAQAIEERDRAVAAAGVLREACAREAERIVPSGIHADDAPKSTSALLNAAVEMTGKLQRMDIAARIRALADTTGEKSAAVIEAAKVWAESFREPEMGGDHEISTENLLAAVDVLDNSRPPTEGEK